jgi:uncharacterized membrane protein YdbT with pleckstrin-like domain
MMYIQQSLGPDEELIHVGHYHWMHDVKAAFNIVFGAIMSVMIIYGGIYVYQKMGKFPPGIGLKDGLEYLHPGFRIAAFAVFVGGLLSFARMMVEKSTTEMAITNLRIVFKRGLLARHVGEIAIDRIEGVVVLQTLMGRVFDYGRLSIRGMGVGEVVLPPIAKPIVFRQAIQKARAFKVEGV